MIEGLPFTIVDIVVVGAILLFGLLSAFWGFVGLVTGIGAWVGAALITVSAYEPISDISRQHIEETWLADMAAGGGLFVGSLIILMILSTIISNRVEDSSLGSINRALGLISGLVLGYGFSAVLLLAGIWLMEEENLPRSVKDGRAYGIVRVGSMAILEQAPKGLQERIEDALEQGRVAVDEASRVKRFIDAVEQPKPSGDGGSGDDTGYSNKDREQFEQKLEEYTQ